MAFLSVMGLYQFDQTIFDPMVVPGDMDKETLVGSILDECSELECVIPDPNVFKAVINYWSKKNLQPWTKMYEAQVADYNPLWNKDGTYKETETRDLRSSGDSTGMVSAFNTSDFQNASRNTANGSDTGTVTRERREYGNIGVTTSTAMLTEEMEFRSRYNVYNIIIEDFKSRFCVLVY
ncbi:hypothetical protein [Ruminobacter sp.]|uniref:hypothetical protein n=1 Tax=Ruminobacter sp. TaxID=2774296 RepID=UPI00386A1D57